MKLGPIVGRLIIFKILLKQEPFFKEVINTYQFYKTKTQMSTPLPVFIV